MGKASNKKKTTTRDERINNGQFMPGTGRELLTWTNDRLKEVSHLSFPPMLTILRRGGLGQVDVRTVLVNYVNATYYAAMNGQRVDLDMVSRVISDCRDMPFAAYYVCAETSHADWNMRVAFSAEDAGIVLSSDMGVIGAAIQRLHQLNES